MKDNILMKFCFVFLLIEVLISSCNEDILNEVPKSFFNPEVVLVNKAGFETAIAGIHVAVRDGYFQNEGTANNFYAFHEGTDVNFTMDAAYQDYVSYLTPTFSAVPYIWDMVYQGILTRANLVIDYAEKPTAQWTNEEEKNVIVAEARFFRAYGHNILANLYGGVPIADRFYTELKIDFVRASREDVYKFVAEDLEFASKWLPETTNDGRIAKAAADHLLAEVYISLGRYDDAIRSASDVIDSDLYELMHERFGSFEDLLGDVFSDLFKEKNQNRSSSGNTETIWALQIEYNTPGGGRYRATRYWNSQYYNIKDPDGLNAMLLCDSLGRPNGWTRGTPHVYHSVWTDRNDMRCSNHNFRWDFYNNNPESKYFGQKIDPNTYQGIDTMRTYYPTIRKLEGIFYDGASSPDIYVDQYAMRLAETYLLRAEAYLLQGDKQKATDDINVVRNRAHAKPATASEIDLDYILDERTRELLVEEPRRLTLIRMNKLVDRVRKYHPYGGPTIQDFHAFWPIPQTAIDANINAVLEQNPGY